MKNRILLITVIAMLSVASFAQVPGGQNLKTRPSLRLEISPMAGYFFGGSVKFYEGKLKIKDNASFGVSVGLPLSNGTLLEFSYTGISSTAEWRPSYAYESKYPERNFGINVNYFNLGGVRRVPLAENIEGFGALRAGAVYFNSTADDVGDVWRFEVSLGGGIKVFLSDKIGLRFQGNMHLPLILSGAGLFCGIGTGGSNCSVGVSSTSSIIQGDLSAGLVFRLGY